MARRGVLTVHDVVFIVDIADLDEPSVDRLARHSEEQGYQKCGLNYIL